MAAAVGRVGWVAVFTRGANSLLFRAPCLLWEVVDCFIELLVTGFMKLWLRMIHSQLPFL